MNKILMLKKNYEFKRVLNKGKFYSGNVIQIIILPNGKVKNLLGIAISSKMCKSHKRNKIKRLIRENYRFINENLEKGYDIVIILKKTVDMDNINFNSIQSDMMKIFGKAVMLKEF